jgi:hypothetical protein
MPCPAPRRALPTPLLLGLSVGCATDYSPRQLDRVLSTSDLTHDAGVIAVGDRETLRVFVLSSGSGPVTIQGITVDDPEHWEVLDAPTAEQPRTLPAGSEQDPEPWLMQVLFKPDEEGDYQTTLTIASDDNVVEARSESGGGLWQMTLRGLAREPCVEVWPLDHDFGRRPVGGYFAVPLTLQNCGLVTLTASDFDVDGDPAFSVQSPPQTLLPGEAAQVDLAFQPSSDAPARGSLRFDGNAPAFQTLAVSLVGNDCAGSPHPSWDADGDGWSSCGGDCDDGDAAISPSAQERADNPDDDDCDGLLNEAPNPVDDDADGDGAAEVDGDCDDEDAAVGPHADDAPNGVDDDCDGLIDEGSAAVDADGDGLSALAGDCDDGDAAVGPGQPDPEDGIDNNCDGRVDEGGPTFDDDGDGVAERDAAGASADCDDGDPWVAPGADEACDGRDNDCDGLIDEDADGVADALCAPLRDRTLAAEAEAAAEEGCASAPGPRGPWWALVAPLLAAARRRR